MIGDIFVVALVGTVLGCWLIVYSILTYIECKTPKEPFDGVNPPRPWPRPPLEAKSPKKPCRDCHSCKCGSIKDSSLNSDKPTRRPIFRGEP